MAAASDSRWHERASDAGDGGQLRSLRPLTRSMAALLWVAGALVLLAGVQLFVFTERTDRYFAWTVQPPLTAAFLGASYWSAVAFEWTAARSRLWAEARIAVPTVFVFTTLTLVVTLAHLEPFHLGAEHELGTRLVTWAWIAVYTVVPVLMLVVLAMQRRVPGSDPPRTRRLPTWIAVVVAAQVVLLLPLGTALLVAPERTASVWPWALSALTGRATGAWLLSLGVAATHALAERDLDRLRPAALAYLLFGLLQGLALVRYPGTPAWDEWTAHAYAVFLVSTVVTGGGALLASRRARADAPAHP